MLMRSIRSNTKWVMLILAIAFAGWLVLDWVQSRDSAAAVGANPVIAVINGEEIRYVAWSQYLDQTLAQVRGANAALTDEERHQAEQTAWEQLITSVLVEQELERLGIEVTDSEVRQAFRLNPPPFLLQHPAFQTDGAFDYEKYREFFASPGVDDNLLLQIEAYYRSALPRIRLSQQLQEGIYLSDAELWQQFRDRSETATVQYAGINTLSIPDSLALPTADAVEDYYAAHRDDFERPATAVVNVVSLSAVPTALDTIATRAQADTLRQEIEAGVVTWESAARRSADLATAETGGELGRFTPGDLVGELETAARALGEGEISEPVLTPRGFHLLRVSAISGDTIDVQHILVPVTLSFESEGALFDRLDRLEILALEVGLTEAADSLGIENSVGVGVTDGFDFVSGAGALGVGVAWAFESNTDLDEVSPFFENAIGYHMLELVERTEPGTYSLDEVRPQIEQILIRERKEALAREQIESELTRLASADSLHALAEAMGWVGGTAGPFSRVDFVQGLGRNTEAVGAAFGLPAGQTAGPYEAGDLMVVIRVDDRVAADSAIFETAKEALRGQLTVQLQQANQERWLEALREEAEIVDLRERLNVDPEDIEDPLPRTMG